jgi:AraC-like DNA-binding protein
MRYAEHSPPDSLADLLHCLWSFEEEDASAEPQRIVPDGRCELVVHMGSPYRERGAPEPQGRVVFAGQLTRPLWLEATGPASVIGARFHPAAARRFLDMPMGRATDTRLDLARLWMGEARNLLRELGQTHDGDARLAAVAQFVANRVAGTEEDATLARCVAALQDGGGTMPIQAVAEIAGIGRRQLERRFLDGVGITPALLANVFRFRRVFDAIQRDSARPWTDAAFAVGYFDQSHLIRDFRRFVGCTPSEFIAARPGLATALIDTPPMSQTSK